MSLGLIVYIEDSDHQRMSLKLALELRGFRVEVAGDVNTARDLLAELRGQIDVLVLDMLLEGGWGPEVTGADVASEYYNSRTNYWPEIVILSAYSKVNYYKLALKLGVATYLEKKVCDQFNLIQTVRALAIRRILSIEHPEAPDRIRRVVEASRNRSEAITNFCRDELEPVFYGRLGTPFIFLLTENDHTYCYTREGGLPESLGLYEAIQARVCSEGPAESPFIFDAGNMPGLLNPADGKNQFFFNVPTVKPDSRKDTVLPPGDAV